MKYIFFSTVILAWSHRLNFSRSLWSGVLGLNIEILQNCTLIFSVFKACKLLVCWQSSKFFLNVSPPYSLQLQYKFWFSAQPLFSHICLLLSVDLMFLLLLKVFCSNLKVTWYAHVKMVISDDDVSSNSEKKLISDKSHCLQILLLLGWEELQITLTLTLKEDVSWRTKQTTASSIPLNKHTHFTLWILNSFLCLYERENPVS